MFPTADAEDNITQVTSVAVSLSSDARNFPENTQVSTRQHRELTFNMLIKEMVFCVALALTTYGALHNTATKVSRHPQAVRFFSPDSVVTDYYRGQLGNALAAVNNADISFVMYYAPWDAESQYVKGEFEKAAMVLGDRVHFAAINCWYPGSECRLYHNKLASWPIMMVYTFTSSGIHYKGPRDAHTMVNFLELMMKPLKRVATAEELVTLISHCDAVAVGFVPFTETSKHYTTWYQVALKAREFDVLGEICFAAVTSDMLAAELGVETVPNARLMLWNGTKEFISDESTNTTWTESSLLMWVLQNFSQPVARITPQWKKSFTFERYVDGSPILMLFTPLNPIYDMLPNYALMREISMEYHNCKNNRTSPWTTELIKLQQAQRIIYQLKDYISFCRDYKFKKSMRKHIYKKGVESRNNKYPWNNSTENAPKSGVFNFFAKRGLGLAKDSGSLDDSMWSLDWFHECNIKTFPAERSFYENYEQCRLFERSFDFAPEMDLNEDIGTTMLPQEDDPLTAENLIQYNLEHKCKLMKFAQEYSPPIFPSGNQEEVRHTSNLTRINGLACSANISLNFLAMDSIHNHHFAEALGVDIRSKKDMTAVVILDTESESQYVLSEEYSAKSVRDFIYKFTTKQLKRSLRTHVDDSRHTHYFASDGKNEQMGIDDETLHIIDLTTKSFRRIVNTPGTMSIVSVCGGGCSAMTSRAVSSAARLLTACGLRARAARLDALRHDLPWHYTAHSYPTIFVFPANRKREADSNAYPNGSRITAGGVVALALRSLGAPDHVRVRIALCNVTQSSTEKKVCLKDIREHITTVIDRNLRYWRRTDLRELKDAFLRRLQHLHQVSLALSLLHVSDLNENSKKHQMLNNSLSSLAKYWDIDDSILRNRRQS